MKSSELIAPCCKTLIPPNQMSKTPTIKPIVSLMGVNKLDNLVNQMVEIDNLIKKNNV